MPMKRDLVEVPSSWYLGWNPELSLYDIDCEVVSNVNQIILPTENPPPEFVDVAHMNFVKVLVSIGGSSGSRYWSSNVASEENRTACVKTVTSFSQTFNLDGLSFDWITNITHAEDSNNFLAFLKLLREDRVGSKLVLTAIHRTRRKFLCCCSRN
ncbi:hypothetical protein BDQ17DRAFT_1543371 [Cyathus striatus]|nr:hypothetical protein BDQ17DRAFT_1543371 [Cyathus striatus]